MSKPLTGIKVLELSTFVAAPSCARLLSDLGAEVIKVERLEGDGWRATGKSFIPSRFCDEENPVFDIYNTGKRHIALNLKDSTGMEVFHKLLAEADVFVTNTRPAALKRLGLSYDELKEKYPALIYAIILGYGEKGPDANKPAFDMTAFWARSGFLRDLTLPGEHYSPVVPPASTGDTVTGYLLLAEICAALYRRTQNGKGDYVRSSLYHNGIFAMGTMAIVTQKPFGRTYPMKRPDHSVPGGYYQCADNEWVFVSTIGSLDTVNQLIGRADLTNDPRFDSEAKCWANREEYYEIFRKAFLTKTSDEWIALADQLDYPLMKMNHFSDVTEDRQAWANDYLEYVEFPSGNVDVMPRSPIEMDSVGLLKTTPAPHVGKHTKSILKELAYSDEEICAMHQAGSIGFEQLRR